MTWIVDRAHFNPQFCMSFLSRRTAAACLAFVLIAPLDRALAADQTMRDRFDQAFQTFTSNPLAKADVDMRHVLDLWSRNGGRALSGLSLADARAVPTLAQALPAPAGASSSVVTRDLQVDGAAGQLPARLYRRAGSSEALQPIILYFGGGSFVRGGLDSAESGARALAVGTGLPVLSVAYRRAPEAKFPAAPDDAAAAYGWLASHAIELGGDPARMILAGEEAGANLAVNVAIVARKQKRAPAMRLLLVTPLVGTDLGTPSYEENAKALPLGKADVASALDQTIRSKSDLGDPRLDLIGHADLAGLPPVTILTAQIDPLRSDGERLAAKIQRAGGAAETRDFPGVTHGFFGLDAAVGGAREASAFIATRLRPTPPPATE